MRQPCSLATAVMVGVGTARLIETIKEALPIIPPPAYKSAVATAIASALGACLHDGDWRGRALTGIGAAGAAMLTHEARNLLSVTADRQKVHVLRAARG